jgi:putative membrane protein insertion efficiency factor
VNGARTRRAVSLASRAVGGVLIFFVRAYQVVLSPHLGHCCRFEPSCSAYCIEALRVHGVLKGCWLALRRVMRCRPFGPSGPDPVPPRKGS